MLNKLQLNNLIISNKKQIQKGHAQAIQKQVQKLRKLKGLLEKHPENEKNKEKYRKATETLAQLKKFKHKEVVKHCMILDKNPTTIVTNGRSTPEEVAIALLAMNKILLDLSAKFKEQLNLTDATAADAQWKEEIMESSKRRAKIQRTEEKRKKRQDIKEQKAVARKRLEWLKENKIEGVDDGEGLEAATQQPEDLNVTASGVWKEEVTAEVVKETKKKAEKVKKPPKKEPIKRDLKKAEKKKPTAKEENTTDTGAEKASETIETEAGEDTKPQRKEKKPPKTTQKEIPASPPKRIKLEPEITLKQEEEETAPVEEEEPFAYVEDPFFITETGESYLSTAVAKKNKPNDDEDNDDDSDEEEDYNAFNRNRHQAKRGERNFERLNNRPSKGSGRAAEPKAPPKIDENLHPSWKAKLKVKPVIGKFQGKKITFNNEDGTGSEVVAKEVPTKVNGGIVKEKLHPSWEAKQKQKPVIGQFQGKKTNFDSEASVPVATKSNGISKVATEKLHPSWEAKQKQKPVITSFQGTKITFD